MKTLFKNISIGGRFHDGIQGARRLVYEKISPSKGKCVEQHGYGNQRALGGITKFGPNHTVWEK